MANMWTCGGCNAYGEVDEFEALAEDNPAAEAAAEEAHRALSPECRNVRIAFE